MPDGIKKAADAIAKSKELLKKGSDFTMKVEGKNPSDYAPKTPAAPVAPEKPKVKGIFDQAMDEAKSASDKADNVKQYEKGAEAEKKDIPSMKDGGKVKKDGPVKLHKDETVLPANDKDKAEKLAMKHLGKKAGAMAAAVEEEKEERAEHETPAEEKKEGKAGEKKEEKKEPKKEEKIEHKGKKVKGIHLRHGSSGGFIAKHDVMPSEDGKMSEPEEHVLPNKAAMLAHIEEHMGDGEDVGTPEGGSPEEQ